MNVGGNQLFGLSYGQTFAGTYVGYFNLNRGFMIQGQSATTDIMIKSGPLSNTWLGSDDAPQYTAALKTVMRRDYLIYAQLQRHELSTAIRNYTIR